MNDKVLLAVLLVSEVISLLCVFKIIDSRLSAPVKAIFALITFIPILGPIAYLLIHETPQGNPNPPDHLSGLDSPGLVIHDSVECEVNADGGCD